MRTSITYFTLISAWVALHLSTTGWIKRSSVQPHITMVTGPAAFGAVLLPEPPQPARRAESAVTVAVAERSCLRFMGTSLIQGTAAGPGGAGRAAWRELS